MNLKCFHLIFLVALFSFLPYISSGEISKQSKEGDFESFSWQLKKTVHFEIYCFPEDEFYAELVFNIAEESYSKIKNSITNRELRKIWVYITRTSTQFDHFKFLKVKPPDWASGLAFPGSNYILLKSPASLRSNAARDTLLTTFKHELAHIVLHNGVGNYSNRIPRWFDEGFASYQSKDWRFSQIRTMALVGLTNSYIPFDNLFYDFPSDESKAIKAYAQSYSFVAYLYEQYGNNSIKGIIDEIYRGSSFSSAVKFIIDKDIVSLEKKWRKRARTYYTWIPLVTSTTTLWFIAALVVTLGFIKRRKRYREALDRWNEEELQEFFNQEI